MTVLLHYPVAEGSFLELLPSHFAHHRAVLARGYGEDVFNRADHHLVLTPQTIPDLACDLIDFGVTQSRQMD